MPSLPARGTLVLALVGLVAALVVAPAAPASAAVTGSTTTSDVVLYDQCQSHRIDYDITVTGASFWRLQLQVISPEGLTSEGYVATSSTSNGAGSVDGLFCGSEAPGTWTVQATGITQVIPGINIPFTLADTTFEVRPAQTTAAVKARRLKGGKRYAVTSTVQREQPTGFAPSEGIYVRIERLVDGAWTPVAKGETSTVHGLAKRRLKLRPGDRLRAVVPAANNYSASTSAPIRLRRR